MTNSYERNALINALLGNSTTPTLESSFGSALGSAQFGSLFAPLPTTPPPPQNSYAGLLGLIGQPSPPLAAPSPAFSPLSSNLLRDLIAPPVAPAPVYAPATIKRKGFFSFHYADIIRVNNVRNAWKINAPGRVDKRQFYDRSLWESVQRKNPEGLKNLIRSGMFHASAVCVLVGTETWSRPWVRYEIARSVIDKKGLLAVHINSLRHHHRLAADLHGENPLAYMAVGSPKQGLYYLYERVLRQVIQNRQLIWQWQWEKYSKHNSPVPLPKYMKANPPQVGYVVPLSDVTAIYDYVAEEGHKNIGAWIDTAALRAGR